MVTLKHPNNFVIAIVEGEEIKSYYGTDPTSGGYPYFPTNLKGAEFFKSAGAAAEVVDGLVAASLKKQEPLSDGTIYPDSDIHRLLGLSNLKLSGSATLTVVELTHTPISCVTVYGEIKRATGFTYQKS